MANKQALRELQNRLAQRLQATHDRSQSASWLAVEAGGQGFLFPLAEAGEIFTGSTTLMAVPHTSRWFAGIANLRGHLHGVVDWAGFVGLRRQPDMTGREQICLVAFNAALDINCALLVDRLAGLRSREQLQPSPAAIGQVPSFLLGSWRDAQGRLWHEVGLAALSGHEAFLKIFD